MIHFFILFSSLALVDGEIGNPDATQVLLSIPKSKSLRNELKISDKQFSTIVSESKEFSLKQRSLIVNEQNLDPEDLEGEYHKIRKAYFKNISTVLCNNPTSWEY